MAAVQRPALQLPPRRASPERVKKRTISCAESGQLQAPVGRLHAMRLFAQSSGIDCDGVAVLDTSIRHMPGLSALPQSGSYGKTVCSQRILRRLPVIAVRLH